MRKRGFWLAVVLILIITLFFSYSSKWAFAGGSLGVETEEDIVRVNGDSCGKSVEVWFGESKGDEAQTCYLYIPAFFKEIDLLNGQVLRILWTRDVPIAKSPDITCAGRDAGDYEARNYYCGSLVNIVKEYQQ